MQRRKHWIIQTLIEYLEHAIYEGIEEWYDRGLMALALASVISACIVTLDPYKSPITAVVTLCVTTLAFYHMMTPKGDSNGF